MSEHSQPEVVMSHNGSTYEVWYNQESGYDWVRLEGTDIMEESDEWFDSAELAAGDILAHEM